MMKQLLFSKKASQDAVNLPFKIIIAIIVTAVIVFGIIPLVTKPLGTDACIQQNGVRASSCDTSVSVRHAFVEKNDAEQVCCVAIPGKKDDFKRWSDTISSSGDPDDVRSVVSFKDAAGTYKIPKNHMALLAPPKPGLLVADYYETGKVFYPTIPFKNPHQAILDLGDDPQQTFDLVGVNDLGNGICSLTVREAAPLKDENGNTIDYRPKTSGTSLVSPEPGFDYLDTDCKKGEGVQITGRLNGLVGNDSYYIATYAVKWKDKDGVEKSLQVYALIKAQLPLDEITATSAEELAKKRAELEDDDESSFDGCTQCDAFVSPSSCNNNTKTDDCLGCWWSDDRGGCVDCSIMNVCTQYDTKESCSPEGEKLNPCQVGACSWSGKICFDCDFTNSCADYPDRKACKANSCRALDKDIPVCTWKPGFLTKGECVPATS